MMPAETNGMTCGRNNTVRATTASRLCEIRRMVAATSRPRITGTKLKNTISSNALRIEPYSSGSEKIFA